MEISGTPGGLLEAVKTLCKPSYAGPAQIEGSGWILARSRAPERTVGTPDVRKHQETSLNMYLYVINDSEP